MEALDAMRTRRSIRKYTGEQVHDEDVDTIIAAGMSAPSAGNEQPWHFLVVRNKNTLKSISLAHPYAEMVREADVAIIVCADLTLVRHKDYWSQDCSAATENMLLAVHALGLGSVWVGMYPRERRVAELRTIISLPEHIIPFSLLPIGLPSEKKEPEERFNRSRIHKETW